MTDSSSAIELGELSVTSGAPLAVSPELLVPIEEPLVRHFERKGKAASVRASDQELGRIARLVLRPCLQAIAANSRC